MRVQCGFSRAKGPTPLSIRCRWTSPRNDLGRPGACARKWPKGCCIRHNPRSLVIANSSRRPSLAVSEICHAIRRDDCRAGRRPVYRRSRVVVAMGSHRTPPADPQSVRKPVVSARDAAGKALGPSRDKLAGLVRQKRFSEGLAELWHPPRGTVNASPVAATAVPDTAAYRGRHAISKTSRLTVVRIGTNR